MSVILASSVLSGCWSHHRGPHPAVIDACVLTTCLGTTCCLGARPYDAASSAQAAGNSFSSNHGHDHGRDCGCRTQWRDGYRAYYYGGQWEYYDGRQWRTTREGGRY